MPSPYISELTLPTGSTYSIKDSEARDLIAAINNWDYVVCTSASNTPKDVTWDDDGTIITGTLVASASTMYKIYLVPTSDEADNDIFDEYITVNPSSNTYTWEKFGSVSAPDLSNYVSKSEAGDLAYKDTATGSSTVAVPKTFLTSTTVATTDSKAVSVTGTTTGSVSLKKSNVEIKTKSTGTNKYTPGGSVTVSSAGSTTTIKNPTSKTVVTDMSVSSPSSTQSTGELLYCTVSGETLVLNKFVETTGDSITTENVRVKNGDASYLFTGTDVYLETASEVGTAASFTGDSMTSTGTVEVPETFTSSTSVSITEDKTVSITVS